MSIEVGVRDEDVDQDQTKTQEMNVIGIPNHDVLLVSQSYIVSQQKDMMESHKKIPESISQVNEESKISGGTKF